jgi:hypothetical protein
MPSASDTIAIIVINGFFRIERKAYLKFMAASQECDVIETAEPEKGYRFTKDLLPFSATGEGNDDRTAHQQERSPRKKTLDQEHPHRMQGACEWMENETQVFQRDNAQKSVVTRFSKDDRRVTLALRKLDVTLRNLAVDVCAVRHRESDSPFWSYAKRLPYSVGKKGVLRTAVHEKLQRAASLGATDFGFDIGDSNTDFRFPDSS